MMHFVPSTHRAHRCMKRNRHRTEANASHSSNLESRAAYKAGDARSTDRNQPGSSGHQGSALRLRRIRRVRRSDGGISGDNSLLVSIFGIS
jgi:hypothetical protein